MQEGKSLYNVLEIEENASPDEIKKAYFLAVRKFPPERFPEEFKKIREAYDTLSDRGSRREYDDMLHTDTRYEKHFKLGREAYESGDYETAYQQLEIARRLLAKRHSVIENLLGLTYMEMEEFKKATEIFRELTREFPGNAVFFSNLGFAYFKRGMYAQTIKAMDAALALDKSNVEGWLALGFCYFKMKEFSKSRKVLESGIKYCGENVSFYLKLIELDAAEDNPEAFEEDVERLVRLTRKDKEMKDNVIWSLTEVAHFLLDERMPEYASKIFEKLRKLNPRKKNIREMHENAVRLERLHSEFDRLKSDRSIHKMLLDYIEGAIFSEEDYFDDEAADVMRRLMLMNAAAILPSVNYIKRNYPLIYEEDREFYETVLANPKGAKGDERKLLADLKRLAVLDGEKPEDVEDFALDDFYIPPMPVVNPDKTGRNDPCPCGSGKKYKKCCLNK